jgi:YgiT-type zinc finger domain-containing protein
VPKEICKICGSNKTEIISKSEKFEYKGFFLTIHNYRTIFCNTCNESIIEKETYEKSVSLLKRFHTKVDIAIKQTLKDII